MKELLGLPIALAAEAEAILGRDSWESAYDCEGRAVKRGRLNGGGRYVAVRSGMGMENSLGAARWLTGEGAAVLAGLGVAGALDPTLKPGDLIVAFRVIEAGPGSDAAYWEADGDRAEAVFSALKDKGLPVRGGSLLTTHQPVFSVEEKSVLFRRHGALAVDMESAAVARAARDEGLPFIAVRAVCDTAGRDVPRSSMEILDQNGRVRPAALIRVLLRNPSVIGGFLSMRKDYDAALASLKGAWRAAFSPPF